MTKSDAPKRGGGLLETGVFFWGGGGGLNRAFTIFYYNIINGVNRLLWSYTHLNQRKQKPLTHSHNITAAISSLMPEIVL